jgi:hypothetical protein
MSNSREFIICEFTQEFYRRFITALTRDLHLSLSWARPNQSIKYGNFCVLRYKYVSPGERQRTFRKYISIFQGRRRRQSRNQKQTHIFLYSLTDSSTLKKEAVYSPETTVNIHWPTWHVSRNRNILCRENLKSDINLTTFSYKQNLQRSTLRTATHPRTHTFFWHKTLSDEYKENSNSIQSWQSSSESMQN